MSAMPYVLAVSSALPDREFPSLRLLARAIVRMRDANGPGLEVLLTPGVITRGELPGGARVSVRLRPRGQDGRGDFLCYALIPGAYGEAGPRLLGAAILAVAQPEPA